MSNAIVEVRTSVTLAPAPSSVQQSGAFISQGGTSLAPGTLGGPYVQMSELLDDLAPAAPIASLTWVAGVVTATLAAPHGWTVGDDISVVVASAVPDGYNGVWSATVTSTTAVTYNVAVNPGAPTTMGTLALGSQAELAQMGNTYFANNSTVGVYILELGPGTVDEGVTALSDWLTNVNAYSPQTIYGVLVPRAWDNNSSFIALCGDFTAPSSKFYFWVTNTVATKDAYGGLKSVMAEIEAPGVDVAGNEFSLAAAFSTTLSWSPSSSSRIPPLSYSYAYGATPWPPAGNGGLFNTLAKSNSNWVGLGVEGGLNLAIQFRGKLSDGRLFNFWYSADWVQINIDLSMSNEIINGSNDTVNPLYYDQQGINRLQARGLQTLAQAISAGLGNGTLLATNLPTQQFIQKFNNGEYVGFIVLNAEPFGINAAENPNDYAQGIYRGFTCVFTPQQGFLQVIFSLNITDIIVPV